MGMFPIPRRDPKTGQRTIAEGKFAWLTKPLGRYQYGTHGGTEYAVELRPADSADFNPRRGEILVSRRQVELVDGSPLETVTHHRGFPVEAGTGRRQAAKARKPTADQRPHAWDRLVSLPLMQRREPIRVISGPKLSVMDKLVDIRADSQAELDALAGAVDQARRRPGGIHEVGGHEPPKRSVAGLIDLAGRQGVTLSLERGQLWADSAKPIRADLLELLERAERMIVGHLQGKPVLCAKCAAPAVTVVAVNAAACAEHAQ